MVSPYSFFSYTQNFGVRFSVSVPTPVLLSAAAFADSLTGWPNAGDVRMSFGRDGDQPIFSWSRDKNYDWMEAFPTAELVLQPGVYTVSALDRNAWSGDTGSVQSWMSFRFR